jgi:hypothetical protein
MQPVRYNQASHSLPFGPVIRISAPVLRLTSVKDQAVTGFLTEIPENARSTIDYS